MSGRLKAKEGLLLRAIVLAAGSSSRMGRPKQLLKIGGVTLVDRTITVARGAGFTRPVLVLGAHADTISRQSQMACHCDIVVNQDFHKGQSSSLVAGIRHILGTCDGAVVMLCDQPFLHAKLIRELTDVFISVKPDFLYPVHKQQRGNPVVLNSSVFQKLLNATGDQGARFLLNDSSLHIVAHDVDDPAVLIDIDTPAEYEKYRICSSSFSIGQ